MTQRERMLTGLPYRPADPELVAGRARSERLLVRLNAAEDRAGRDAVLRELLGAIGEGTEIRVPFACDYGFNIRIGRDSYVNFNCVFLDCAEIVLGDRVMLAPGVQLLTATHPLDPVERASGLEFARPIRVGDDAWIGGGAVVLPGVTIGAAAVVGAASLVRADVPPRAVVAGNPARVIRTLP